MSTAPRIAPRFVLPARLGVAALTSLVACGAGDAGPAEAPRAPIVAPAAALSSAPAGRGPLVASPASSEPTALTPEQKRRDAARAPLAASVVDAYGNWNGMFSSLVAEWSHDGKQVLFGSTRDGVPEIYVGDAASPAAAPRAITTGPERAIWAAYSADGKAIFFLRDTKADENHHIFRAGTDGSNPVDLTPSSEPLQRGEPLNPRLRPDTILYTGSKTTAPSTMLFALALPPPADGKSDPSAKPAEPRLVYTDPSPSVLASARADGARALLISSRSFDDNAALEIDVATGGQKRIYPREGEKAVVTSASYSPDGKTIYVGTDGGAESTTLLALDANTGKEIARYVSDTPRAAGIRATVSPKGDRIAIDVDGGDHGEVRILDARSLRLLRAAKVPLGNVQVGEFRRDGGAFSIVVSTPDHPPDVYAVDTKTAEVRPLRDDRRPGLDALPPIDAAIEKVPAFDGLTIPINRYLPKAPGAKVPTLVIFHGGPATSYSVRWSPYARFFLSLGYAVLEPNVRGSSGFGRAFEMADNREKRADWLQDVATVNAWVKQKPWCDADRVIVWGQSYGGYTTLMALTRQPDLWRAGVDLYGVADLTHFLATTEASIRSFFVTEFGDVEKDAALLERFSPMRDKDKIVAPLFVYAGANDPRVPVTESNAIVRAARERGVPVEYMVAASEGHSVDRRETKIELLTRTARFLEDATRPSR